MFYFMAPFFVFLETLVDVFFRLPYQIVLSLLDTFYPIYVFCGVACIAGGIIGVTARIISNVLVSLLEVRPSVKTEVAYRLRKLDKGKAKA